MSEGFWTCLLCKSTMTIKDKEHHLRGERHKKTAASVSWYCTACQISIPIDKRDEHFRGQGHMDKLEKIGWWTCLDCKVNMQLHDKESHLKGKNHIATVNSKLVLNGQGEAPSAQKFPLVNENGNDSIPNKRLRPLEPEHSWVMGNPPVVVKYIRTSDEFESIKNIISNLANTACAIDCEGVPDSLDLIQIATSNDVYILDCVTLDKNLVCKTLKTLFESNTVLKIFHDLHEDLVALKRNGIENFNNILDTQLISEFLWDNPLIGLNDMFERLLLPKHPLKDKMKRNMRDYPDMWKKRPLQKDALEYAAFDVILLVQAFPMLKTKVLYSWYGIMCASESRAKNTVQNNGKRSICFDKKNKYKITSAELIEHFRPEDAIKNEPLKTKCEVRELVDLLPKDLQTKMINDYSNEPTDEAKYCLNDIIFDIGRRPCCWMGGKRIMLSDDVNRVATKDEIDAIISNLGGFGTDNRAGIEKKLHRISGIPDRNGNFIGLTMRVGRWFQGNTAMLTDLLLGCDKSILILGEPGSGKSTIVREAVRVLAEHYNVCVVDTSNEIGGDGAIPHPCIGLARRMMVPSLEAQSKVMVECVQNHTPHVMCIDEIGRPKEVDAARTVKQRGVRIIASAHGNLRTLIKNKEIRGLIGGIETVTLGDAAAKDEARRKGEYSEGISKTKTQRMGEPTFEVIIEVSRGNFNEWRIVNNVAKAVDNILDGKKYDAQMRIRDPFKSSVILELLKA